MKLAVCLLAVPAAGLVAPAAPARSTALHAEMSKSLPFLMAPKGLKGYIGEEAGFDPVGIAEIMDIKWMREAEIKHGRVAMLATIGFTYPEMPWFVQAFPGAAYAHTNPVKAALAVPPEAWAQVVLFCGVMEWSQNGGKMTMLSMFDKNTRAPGDFGWDPMGLMSPANEDRMKMRELQHGRLAMIAIGGMIHGSFVTGTGVFGGTM
jgi:hypothetical protein